MGNCPCLQRPWQEISLTVSGRPDGHSPIGWRERREPAKILLNENFKRKFDISLNRSGGVYIWRQVFGAPAPKIAKSDHAAENTPPPTIPSGGGGRGAAAPSGEGHPQAEISVMAFESLGGIRSHHTLVVVEEGWTMEKSLWRLLMGFPSARRQVCRRSLRRHHPGPVCREPPHSCGGCGRVDHGKEP